jgi:PST family polysaccharide transporter
MSSTNDKDSFLDIEAQKKHLKKFALKGSVATFAGQISQQVLKIISVVIIARILTPNDYGLIAMISSITGIVLLFKDLGLSVSTIQKEKITHYEVSNLFWLNILLSFIIWIVILSLAPVIAWFYGRPELLSLTIAISLGFVLSGLSIQHQAILKRKMLFGSLISIAIASQAISITVGIISALSGAGVWTLVYMELTRSFSNVVLTWLISKWRPSLPNRSVNVRPLVKFGANFTGANILSYIHYQLPSVLIGKFHGSINLGFYDKAYELMLFPIRQINQPIASVAISALSRLQTQHDRFAKYYESALVIICYASMPIIAYLVIMAEPVILLLIGPQWTETAHLFSLFGIYGMFMPFVETKTWLMISTGNSGKLFKWSLIDVSITLLVVIFSVKHGVKVVVINWVIIRLLLMLPSLWYATYYSPVKLWNVISVSIVPLINICISALVLVSFKEYYLSDYPIVVELIITFSLYLFVFTASDCLINRSFVPYKKLVHIYKDIFKK